MNIKQFTVQEIKYGNKTTKGIVIGSYSHKWKLRYHPLFAALLGNKGLISKTTRQKNGVVYIPLSELYGLKKLKIVSGKGANYHYRILRNIEIKPGGFMVTAEATDYDRSGQIEFNHEMGA